MTKVCYLQPICFEKAVSAVTQKKYTFRDHYTRFSYCSSGAPLLHPWMAKVGELHSRGGIPGSLALGQGYHYGASWLQP